MPADAGPVGSGRGGRAGPAAGRRRGGRRSCPARRRRRPPGPARGPGASRAPGRSARTPREPGFHVCWTSSPRRSPTGDAARDATSAVPMVRPSRDGPASRPLAVHGRPVSRAPIGPYASATGRRTRAGPRGYPKAGRPGEATTGPLRPSCTIPGLAPGWTEAMTSVDPRSRPRAGRGRLRSQSADSPGRTRSASLSQSSASP
jgi:hypothetical protein